MASYIKPAKTPDANATSFELLEKTAGGEYLPLADASEINFALEDMRLAEGDHTLVVVAKADGYLNSDYSNEVVYTVLPTTDYWVLEKLNNVTHDEMVLNSMLGSQYFVFDGENSIQQFTGKTINGIWFGLNKDASNLKVDVFLVDLSNQTIPTTNWQLKQTLTVSGTAGEKLVFDLDEFTVPSGYALGVRASLSSVSSTKADNITTSLDAHYYSNGTAETSTYIGMRAYDFRIKV